MVAVIEYHGRVVEKSPRRVASVSTYLDLDLVHIGGLEKSGLTSWRARTGLLTKLLTMIFESPLPAAGPLGTTLGTPLPVFALF